MHLTRWVMVDDAPDDDPGTTDDAATEASPGGEAPEARREGSQAMDLEEPVELQGDPDPRLAELEQGLRDAEERAAAYLDRLQRLQAEFQNYKKRQRREAAEAQERALDPLLRQLLDVLDNLDRALEAAPGKAEALREGVALTRRQLADLLASHDVTPEDPLGAPFDPRRHEALMRQETAEAPDGSVLEVLARGYLRDGRVLRPARVKVAVAPADPAGERETEDDATGEGDA